MRVGLPIRSGARLCPLRHRSMPSRAEPKLFDFFVCKLSVYCSLVQEYLLLFSPLLYYLLHTQVVLLSTHVLYLRADGAQHA